MVLLKLARDISVLIFILGGFWAGLALFVAFVFRFTLPHYNRVIFRRNGGFWLALDHSPSFLLPLDWHLQSQASLAQ